MPAGSSESSPSIFLSPAVTISAFTRLTVISDYLIDSQEVKFHDTIVLSSTVATIHATRSHYYQDI